MTLKKYRVRATWKMYDAFEVQASSEEEARAMVQNGDLSEGFYSLGSFTVEDVEEYGEE